MISREKYYTGIAQAISLRSPCLKAQVGAVIVKDDNIIGAGFNGTAKGKPHCIKCAREGYSTGKGYDLCPAVHAEINAIINSVRDTARSTIYIHYKRLNGKRVRPQLCKNCSNALINAGIENVVI